MPAPGHPVHEALFHYYSEFDAMAVLDRHRADPAPEGTPGTVTNFLGLKVPVSVHPPLLEARDGQVEGLPQPGNWHADIAEWAAALVAVEAAQGTFRVVEAGCGWGCWLMNTGIAARKLGLTLDLVGVEGDSTHLAQAHAALAVNGFAPGDFRLVHGIAAPETGKAIFPGPGAAGWGGQAQFFPDAGTLARAEADPAVQVLDCYPLSALASGKGGGSSDDTGRIDLLHIDIQGAEVDFVTGNWADISAHAARVLIGTHSRAIEGALMAHFLAHGWRLEMERAAIAPLQGGQPVIAIDGVQMWANPALTTPITAQ